MAKKISPNVLGEELRDYAFLPDGNNTVGCYSTFIVNPDFKKIENDNPLYETAINLILFGREKYDISEELHKGEIEEIDVPYIMGDIQLVEQYNNIYYNEEKDILMGYYWNGDGTLFFKKNGVIVRNTDCKKDYNWKGVRSL